MEYSCTKIYNALTNIKISVKDEINRLFQAVYMTKCNVDLMKINHS